MSRIWYKSPADDWNEALPIGNGRIGGMVFGGAMCDRIQINEETICSGRPFMEKRNHTMDEMLKMFIKNGVRICETGPELETNESVQSMWKTFDARRHKRRRCFIKEI